MNKKDSAIVEKLISRIDACILRVLKSQPSIMDIRFEDGQWIIKRTA